MLTKNKVEEILDFYDENKNKENFVYIDYDNKTIKLKFKNKTKFYTNENYQKLLNKVPNNIDDEIYLFYFLFFKLKNNPCK